VDERDSEGARRRRLGAADVLLADCGEAMKALIFVLRQPKRQQPLVNLIGADANAVFVAFRFFRVPGVCRNHNFIAGAQEHLISRNIDQELTGGDHANLIKRVAMIGNRLAHTQNLFDRLKPFGLKDHKNLRFFGNVWRLPPGYQHRNLLLWSLIPPSADIFFDSAFGGTFENRQMPCRRLCRFSKQRKLTLFILKIRSL
jgi:hypothetical protein